ncbi:hypothetical protein LCGC14_2034600 [marine sediment metagenome]|uniref:Uncharacterized protein n=1 Tax=marine sediment metagenome TaxID=412755 RepID=A0A0F9H753_9ZZZZ
MDINWSAFPDVLIIASIAMLLLGIVGVTQRWRKGFPMLGFKEWVDGVKNFVAIIWVVSMMVIFVLTLIPVLDLVEAAAVTSTESGYWVLHYIVPQAYVLTGFILLVLVMVRLSKWTPLKYNRQERVFLREEKLKRKAKLGRFGFLINVKEGDVNE